MLVVEHSELRGTGIAVVMGYSTGTDTYLDTERKTSDWDSSLSPVQYVR